MKKYSFLLSLLLLLGCSNETKVKEDVLEQAKYQANLSGARMLVSAGKLGVIAGEITKEGKYTCSDVELSTSEYDAYGIKLNDSNCYIIVDEDLNIVKITYGKNIKDISIEELGIKEE